MQSRSARRPWWAIGFLTLGGLWMLFVGCLFLTGYWTTVTVTGGSVEGFCDVVWEDPAGQRHDGESDCYNEPPGSRFEVRVSGWPDAGEPTLTETYVGMGLVFGLPPFALGGGWLLHLARRRHEEPTPDLMTPPAARNGYGPALSTARTAAALRRATRRARRFLALGVAGWSAAVLIMVVQSDSDTSLRDTATTTVGTLASVDYDAPPIPGGASVRFTADGETRTHYVWLGADADDYVAGQEVFVVYDPDHLDRFTIDDSQYAPAWTHWLLGPVLVVAVAGAFLGVSLMAARARMRRVLATRVWAPVRVRVSYDEDRVVLTTADAAVWCSVGKADWPEPPDDATASDAWCASDGARAVFSPDLGSPLVLARLRTEGPIRRLARARTGQASGCAEAFHPPAPIASGDSWESRGRRE
ncbi:hypothetical protein [Blastococcus deserti]|uniref:DUF3592 domain-containing protein n=1 Tax=Blastococcus deserti TaxID=2259033 RepID=A0ABW4XAU2_9ACTN